MKFKKTAAIALTAALASTIAFSAAACTGGDDTPAGTTRVDFAVEVSNNTRTAWNNLIAAYNNGQGKIDKVEVQFVKGATNNPASSKYTESAAKVADVIAVTDGTSGSGGGNHFQGIASGSNNKFTKGYLLELDSYIAADADFRANDIPEQTKNWWKMTFSSNLRENLHVVGPGNPTLAVPVGTSVQFNWFNRAYFEDQDINVITVPEEDLATAEGGKYANVKPHGYAEYLEAPFTGAVRSANLNGEQVYKVFNASIGMNWAEQRVFMKYFTQDYNSTSPSEYAYTSEYWFNYGWSVGGDVMGWNGESYDFTLMDKSANYLVTAETLTVNNREYKRGDILTYEDKKSDSSIASYVTQGKLYAIASQYDAVFEYLALQVPTADEVDTGRHGYGVANPNTTGQDANFNAGNLAFVRGTNIGSIKSRSTASKANDFDMCMPETYREYDDNGSGSGTYYKGAETFANEYMMVIGKTYNGQVYTGDLKVVNNTPIVGNGTTCSSTLGLTIPKALTSEKKRQAAWDFISWMATEGQQYIAATTDWAPVSKTAAENTNFTNIYGKDWNYYVIAKLSLDVSRGDWGYFNKGSWVTNWSDDFNGFCRLGDMTMTQFLDAHKNSSTADLNNDNYVTSIIKGIR